MRIDKVKGFYQLIRDTGHEPSIREEGIVQRFIDNKISQKLNLPDGSEVLVAKRTLLGDGKPAIHLREYIPINILTRNPEANELPDSIFEMSEQFLSQRIEYSISEIIPTIVDSAMI